MADYATKPVREPGTGIVQDYLDTLLSEVSGFADTPTLTPTATERAPQPDTPLSSPVETVSDALEAHFNATLAAVAITHSSVPPDSSDPPPEVQKPAILTRVGTEPEDTKSQPSRAPSWRDHEFASLLFEVSGLQIAAPLHHLGGISPLSVPLQTVAQQADWFMGLMRWNGRNIRVVDTARLIMPERLASMGTPDYQSMVVLGDSHWALAATAVTESIILQSDEVKWHRGSIRRPWLSGMLIHRLCVLVDVERLICMLDDAC